jgi:methylenetetrahydrofolate reductase (NADPH)
MLGKAPPTGTHRQRDPALDCATEFAATGSLEMSAHRPQDAAVIASMLPVAASVFVNHLPRHALADTLETLMALHRVGLQAVPHIAARRVESREELRDFLRRATRNAGVQRVLVIGGDMERAVGPYQDALSLLADGLVAEAGIREIGVASYPEGHPRIAKAELEQALTAKLELIDQQGGGAFAVTQFSFAPIRIVEHCIELDRRHPNLPVLVGMPGPTSIGRLLQFAQRCGVSASLRALQAQGMGAVRLITHTDPGEQLIMVARHCATSAGRNIVGVHLFSFGDAKRAAVFIRDAMARGDAS